MDFLVRIEVVLPPDMDELTRGELLRRESARGRELKDSGAVRRIWRIPGRLANVGIWSAPSADELHEALTSLPVWRYADISITELATHRLFAEPTITS
jgi:muconolactone D-isomerase